MNRDGDPAAGKLVFTKQCAKCHTHTAAGTEGKVGPDLSGFAVNPKPELLIAILDPAAVSRATSRLTPPLPTTAGKLPGCWARKAKPPWNWSMPKVNVTAFCQEYRAACPVAKIAHARGLRKTGFLR